MLVMARTQQVAKGFDTSRVCRAEVRRDERLTKSAPHQLSGRASGARHKAGAITTMPTRSETASLSRCMSVLRPTAHCSTSPIV